jgi:hypothetical protein
MKDLSLLAKLLAEEDIHVVHKQQSTATFDVLNRELALPIWKDMSKNIQDLMTLHEVGHALWTPLEMMTKIKEQKISHSVCNVLEDVRIEKAVQLKYKGAVKIFNKGYQELIHSNFFETIGKDIKNYNLIDRINLHFKHHTDVPFSDEEMVWVKKANETVTSDDVIELAKELIAFIEENPESQGKDTDTDDLVMPDMGQPSMGNDSGQDENDVADQEFDMPSSSKSEESEESEENSDEEKSAGSESSDEDSDETKDETSSAGSEKSDEDSDDKSETKDVTVESASKGGGDGDFNITATTDNASVKSAENMLDKDAGTYQYSNIPSVDLKKVIVPTKEILDIFKNHYLNEKKDDDKYWNKTLNELNKTKTDSKKAVSYMVKEFEMKKSADAYARATTSKTGTLDMGQLHTYKYNDDLFAKVTTLPGAKNHGLVLFLDWSGSMAHNLVGTMNQLYNIIWFCNRVNIPFEVYGFSNVFNRKMGNKSGYAQNFKSGDLVLNVSLLNFFSSKMKTQEQNDMMHYLYLLANRWSYRDWRTAGYPYHEPASLTLGSTPLNDTIVCAMDLIPQFKKTAGVQKMHTVFLTDGASNSIHNRFHVCSNNGQISNGQQGIGYGTQIFTDVKSGNKVSSKDYRGYSSQTKMLLALLKKKMPDMNVVNFFVAGGGRKGNVSYNDIRDVVEYDMVQSYGEMQNLVKKCNKENVLIVPKGQGFDVTYILPGPNKFDMNTELDLEDGVTYNKSQLKRAFGKMSNGKTANRPLLNNFIKMVA